MRIRVASLLGFIAVLALFVPAPAAARQTPEPSLGMHTVFALPVPGLGSATDAALPPDRYRGTSAVTAPTGDYRIDALLSGSALQMTTVTYSFYDDDVFHGDYYGSIWGYTGVREISDAMKDNVRHVLALYESVINVDFVEVAETPTNIGYIRFMLCPAVNYGMAFYPEGTDMFSMSGDVMWNPAYDRLGDGNGFQHPAGMWGYQNIVHESGHALGLKHPFDGANVLPTAENTHFNTTMSYTGTWISLAQSPATPMAYDLLALQYMYGARPKNSGDDVYRLTSLGTSQYTLNGTTWQPTHYQTKQAIWDSGGKDTIEASDLPFESSGYRFDLRGGGRLVSLAYHPQGDGYQGGCSLAFPFEPEDFINSSSSDRIIANGSANTFGGYTAGRSFGADTITGATSADTLDLSGYPVSAVNVSLDGSDLVLYPGSNGSIRLVDFFLGNTPTITYARTGILSGAVTSEGVPLAGATVSADGLSAITDASGAYVLAAVPAGTYTAIVAKGGFVTQSPRVTVYSDRTTTLDVALVREFVIYRLAYAAAGGGRVTGSVAQNRLYGESGNPVTAWADTGYHFEAWSDGNTANPRTDAFVTANVDVAALFAINTCALRYAAGPNGAISGTASQIVSYNASGTSVTAVPAAGYHFVSWSDGGTIATRTEMGVTSDKSVTANFAINTYTLNYAAGSSGTIGGTSPQAVNHGASGTAVTATPATGYHFVSWSDGRITATRTDTGVTADKSVSAEFAVDTYTLSPSAGANGSISPSTVRTVNYASGLTFTVTASPGYHVADVLVDGESAGAVGSYTFTNVSGNHTIAVTFEANPVDTFALSYAASAGGSILGSSTQLVVSGASGSAVTAVPAANYHFVSWSDGVLAAMRTDINVTANKSATAIFAIDTHTVTSSAGSGGSISTRGVSVIEYGSDSATYTITPASGYVIGDVRINGASQGAISAFKFTNMTENQAIAVSFKRISRLSITSDRTTSTGGRAIAFSGTVSPNVANNTHVTVWIRKSTTSRWTVLSTRRTFGSRNWSYSLSTRTRSHGTYYVQVRYAGSSMLTAATSASRRIVIK